jgi:hypothetical protein
MVGANIPDRGAFLTDISNYVYVLTPEDFVIRIRIVT